MYLLRTRARGGLAISLETGFAKFAEALSSTKHIQGTAAPADDDQRVIRSALNDMWDQEVQGEDSEKWSVLMTKTSDNAKIMSDVTHATSSAYYMYTSYSHIQSQRHTHRHTPSDRNVAQVLVFQAPARDPSRVWSNFHVCRSESSLHETLATQRSLHRMCMCPSSLVLRISASPCK